MKKKLLIAAAVALVVVLAVVALGHAVICSDCGGYRNEDAEFCTVCIRNNAIKEWLKSEDTEEPVSVHTD